MPTITLIKFSTVIRTEKEVLLGLTSMLDVTSDESLLLLLLLLVEFELFVAFLGPRGGILFSTFDFLLTVNVLALDGDT